jgi:cellulose synthase/poly-beta-1,6-N-acetylglucosamine synthase-like glycosyltransferase
MSNDPRLLPPDWDARGGAGSAWRLRLLLTIALPLAVLYATWLLRPERVGNPVLFGLLVAAEGFNLTQAIGFWWTAARQRCRPALRLSDGGALPRVDVFVPVYDEPVEVVEPTIAMATRLRAAQATVHLLDDGASAAMRSLARRYGVRYVARDGRNGAKAGNINNALGLTSAPYVLVLDCDHVPRERFLEATLGHLADERVAFVQTPQYYANHRNGAIPAAAWAQQALFFGAIARGKDARGAMFCCGTNVVFRREALEDVGGFPEDSITEDFELSVRLHERGWRSAYVPEVLACGLGPEDMASYVSQQQRWARGCLGAVRASLRARLPWGIRAQYLLSSMYFLSGWTVLVYMSMPVVRILTGAQPLGAATADQFLIHFVPYFGLALYAVALAGGGTYTFAGFALQAASFWIHVKASVLALLGRRGRFVVTPKRGAHGRQLRPVWPALLAILGLAGAAVYGLTRDHSPSTLNNVAFAALHVTVLLTGVWAALAPRAASAGEREEEEQQPERALEAA